MNWLAIALVGTVAAWFEYNYQQSRRKKARAEKPAKFAPVSDSIRVERKGDQPSISPGSENDQEASRAV